MLYQKILNKLDEQRGLSEELAPISGYKNGQALRKALREQREFGSFNGLIKLVQELFPNEENQLLSEYALTLDPNKQTARCMLEYAEIYKLTVLRRELVTKMKDCSNIVSKQWAEIHEIDINYIKGEINYLEALSSLEKINAKSEEIRSLKKIYKAYCYLDEQLYDLVIDMLNSVEIDEEINDFIEDIIAGRYYLLLSECFNRKGEVDKSREFAKKLINEINCSVYHAWGDLHLANSYILTDYDKSYSFLLKGLLISKNMPLTLVSSLKRSMNFLDNVWGKKPRYLDVNSTHVSDVHEVAFNLINEDQINQAIGLLDSLEVNRLSFNQKGFHFYLKGLISKNIVDYCESVKNFKKSGDSYYRRLPLMQLKNLNVDDCIIEVMAA